MKAATHWIQLFEIICCGFSFLEKYVNEKNSWCRKRLSELLQQEFSVIILNYESIYSINQMYNLFASQQHLDMFVLGAWGHLSTSLVIRWQVVVQYVNVYALELVR